MIPKNNAPMSYLYFEYEQIWEHIKCNISNIWHESPWKRQVVCTLQRQQKKSLGLTLYKCQLICLHIHTHMLTINSLWDTQRATVLHLQGKVHHRRTQNVWKVNEPPGWRMREWRDRLCFHYFTSFPPPLNPRVCFCFHFLYPLNQTKSWFG